MVRKLKVKNFKSFGDAEIDIPKTKGLFLVKGENFDAGGSIGSGKTSLLEAVAVGLFGRSPSGLTSAECIRLGEDDYEIHLFLERDKPFEVKRTVSDLFVSGASENLTKTQRQEIINRFIGCDVKTFFACVFVGSDWNSIFDMSPSQRLNFLATLFNLSLFDRCLKRVSGKIKTIESNIRDVEVKIAQFVGRAKELEKSYAEKIVEWEHERKAVIANIEKEKRSLFDKIDKLREEAETLKQKMQKLEKELADMDVATVEYRISVHERNLDKVNKKLEELKAQYEVLNSDYHKYGEHLKFVNKKKRCPLCGSNLKNQELASELKERRAEIANEMEKLSEEMEKLIDERDKIKSSIAQLKLIVEKVTSIEHEKLRLKLKQERIKDEISLLRAKIKDLSERIVTITSEENPYRKLEEERKEKLNAVLAKISSLNEAKADFEKQLQIYQFWKDGFPELKRKLVHNIMSLIADRMNHYLKYLGVDYTVEVFIDDTKIEFSFKRRRNKFSFKNLSSGEKQVARIALALTLHDLAVNVIGKNIGVFFFDEPLRNLDLERKNKVFQLLSELATKNQVFVIDHSPEFADRFDCIISVRKENGISTVSSVQC